jgi:SAM-dependent methyltransferase
MKVIVKSSNIEPIRNFYNISSKEFIKTDENNYGSNRIDPMLSAPYSYLESYIKNYFSKILHNHRFLDLCCGTGIHSILPAKIGYHVDAVDLSDESINAAQHLAKMNSVSNATSFFIANAIEYLEKVEDNYYDVIYISGSLYYLPLEETIKAINRVLNNQGIFCAVETYGGNRFMKLVRVLRYFIKKDRDIITIKNLLSKKEILEIKKYFKYCEVKYFDFFTLFGALFIGKKSKQKKLFKILKVMDDILLNKFGVHFLAFKFIIQAKNE